MTEEITFITWRWTAVDGTRCFESHHVNVLRAMIARHAPFPHRLVCITDDTTGLDASIEAFSMPHTGFEHVAPPAQRRDNKEWPSCYRRLWVFSEKAKELGNRLFCLDIDCVVTGDLSPLVEKDADFVGWCHPRFEKGKIAGGAYLLRAGTHTEVWETFDPETSPGVAARAGFRGSDQAWVSYVLFPPDAQWLPADGLIKIGWIPRPSKGPGKSTKIVFTSGVAPPWNKTVQRRHPWIRDYWHL